MTSSRVLGYTGDRMTNTRPDDADRMTNVRVKRLISVPIRHVPALASGQLTLDLNVRPVKAPRARKGDYPAGPYEWTLEQAHSCLEVHAKWGDLYKSLVTCWAEPRPACWPPQLVIAGEDAVIHLLSFISEREW